MKTINVPDETPELFNMVADCMSEQRRNRLLKSWMNTFRESILIEMPVAEVGKNFSDEMGRPTKELYSVCGLILIMKFFNWTVSQAVDAYCYHQEIHYALNLQMDDPFISEATLHRYLAFFRDDEIGEAMFTRITSKLISQLKINASKQRLDSTHVASNIAALGRRSMIFMVIQSFLKQLNRKDHELYLALPEDLRERYAGHNGWIFAPSANMRAANENEATDTQSESVLIKDMLFLSERFGADKRTQNMTSFKNLLRVITEQVEESEAGKKSLKKHPGGKVLVNPSDPEAEISQKGVGFKVQVMETCGDPEKPNLVTTVVPQGASVTDCVSLKPVLNVAEENGVMPEQLLCDGGYGSQANVDLAADRGVQLVAPCTTTAGRATTEKKEPFLEKCEFNKHCKLVRCPNGCAPVSCVKYPSPTGKPTQWIANFNAKKCEGCPFREECRARRKGKLMVLHYQERSVKGIFRRKIERTPEFRDTYRKRSGIESLFGRLKQNHSLRRLRVRGRKSVFGTIYAIFAMHNVMQAHAYVSGKNDPAPAGGDDPEKKNGKGRKAQKGLTKTRQKAIWTRFSPLFIEFRTSRPAEWLAA